MNFQSYKNKNQYYIRKKEKDEKAFKGSINILSKLRGKSQVVMSAMPRLLRLCAFG